MSERNLLPRRIPLGEKIVYNLSMVTTMPAELEGAFPPRPADANKYSVGTVAIVGGCPHYPHAPVIAALGARAGGAGLVQLVVPDASRYAAGALVPEATFTKLSATCVPPKADVTVIGMGLGQSVTTEVIVSRLLSGSKGRFVLDADALTVLAQWYGKKGGYKPAAGQEIVLTPHEGEAARLLGWKREKVAAERDAAVSEIVARYRATVVLKGRGTVVASSDGARKYVNGTGNPCMALGGMGDLLAGVLGARWAYLGGDPFLAAASDKVVESADDPSIANTAAAVGSLRVRLERRKA